MTPQGVSPERPGRAPRQHTSGKERRPQRVAYVCTDPGVPVFGCKGSSVHVQEVVRALRGRGARVDLFATRIGGEPPADLAEVAVKTLPPLPKVGEVGLEVRERDAVAANAELAAALATAGPFDLVYERYALWSVAGMRSAAAAGAAGVIEVNAPLVDEQATHRGLHDRAGAERLTRLAFSSATAVLAVSEAVATWARARRRQPGGVHVVPNGVDPARFAIGPHRQTDGTHPFTVAFVGTLKPWHGVDVLIAAFARLLAEVPDARLLLVGDGPQRPLVDDDIAARGLADHVTCTGAVAPERIPGLLAEADVAVAPYPAGDHYFSPLKVYEYLAAGLAVVASDVGQCRDAVTDGRTGVLVPPGDVPALGAALVALAGDPDRRARLGAAARQQVIRRHTWDAVAGRILDLAGTTPGGIDAGRRGRRSPAATGAGVAT